MQHNIMICTTELRVTNLEISVYYLKHLFQQLKKLKDLSNYKKKLQQLKMKYKTILEESEVLTLKQKCDQFDFNSIFKIYKFKFQNH